MVAIVSGNGFGLNNTSAGVLGQSGLFGNAALGNSKEAAYVNVANGNLLLQDTDDFLAAQGFNIALTRTYNSLGNFNDGNGGGWKVGPSTQVTGLTGTLNTAGSTVTRIGADGASALYTYDAALGLYRSTDGAGGYDNLRMNASSEWVWTSERRDMLGIVEVYDSTRNAGRITSRRDQNGALTSYQYNAASQLSQITDANGNNVYYDYTAGNLTQIRAVPVDTGLQSTTVRYGYDATNRLTTVTIDLTPGDNSVADAKTYVTSYTYRGATNQIASVTQADGTLLTFGYTQVPATTGPWLLTSVTDGLSLVTSYDYTSGGANTTKVTDPLGYITTYKYDAKGQLTDVTAPAVSGIAAQTTHYAYDAYGNVASITDALGLVTTYQYDANGNRVYERDATGNTITRSYDSNSNNLLTETIYRVADPDGAGAATATQPQSTNYVYDSGNRLRFVVSPEGRVVEYRYNAAGQRAAELHYANISTTALASNATAQSQATLDAMTAWAAGAVAGAVNRVDYSYDVHGLASQSSSYQLINSVATGTAQNRQYVYDQHGLLLSAIDGKGNTTTYTYDGLGRRLSSKDALGNLSTTSYNAAGNTVSVTQANGLIVNTAYNKDGRVTSVVRTNAANTALGTTGYTYNNDNQVYKISDPAGLVSYIIYDTAGRKVGDIDASGALTEYRYNQDNQVTRTIRYATLVTASKMSAITGVTAIATVRPTAAAGDISNWNLYDGAGRLSETLDALGNVTHYDYDGASRMVQTIERATALTASQLTALATVDVPTAFGATAAATDRVKRAFYDNDGQLLAKLDADGYLTESSYDGLGQLIETIAYATPTPAGQRAAGTLAALRPAAIAADVHQRYVYNAQGQVAAAIDGNGYLTRTSYDSAGNATSVRQYTAAVVVPAGATLAAIDSLVAGGAYLETLYTYSALNQRVTEKGADGVTTRSTYDNVGNVTEVRRALSTTDERITQMRYDLLGNVTAQLTPAGAALLAGASTQAQIDAIWTANAVQYTYSADGLRTSMKDASGNRTLYYYDNDNKLVYSIEANGAVTARVYDAFDRLTSLRMSLGLIAASTLTGMTGGTVTSSVTSTVAAVQAAADSIEAFAYDKAGRVIDDTNPLGGHTLTNYDALGNVVQVTQTDAALAALGTVTYTYDAAGRLLRSNDNGALTYYVYDALGRVVGKVAPNGALTEFVYDADNRLLRSTTYATAVDGAAGSTLAQLRPAASANDRGQNNRYDGAGRLTDSVDAGNFLTHYDYDGAGRVVKSTRYATAVAAGSFAAPAASADDRVTRTLYNAAGELVAKLDADGYLTRYLYNGGGQLLETIAFANATPAGTRASGDLSALLPATHSDDIHQHYLYNAAGQLIAAVDGDNYLTEIAYDIAGNVLKRTRRATAVTAPGAATVALMGVASNANDQVTSYTYSALHQMLTKTEPDGTVTRYTYDKMGNVTETRRAVGASDERAAQTQYDALGRVTAELTPLGVAAIAAGTAVATAWASYSVKYTYNGAGQRASMTDQNGRRTLYYYDASGNPSYQINAAGEVNSYRYSLFNQQISTTEINGRIAAATLAALTGNETAASIAATVAAITALGAGSTQGASYDTLGRVIDRVDALGFHATSSYDAFGDLLRSVDATSGIATAYKYDHRGNRVSTTPYANVAGSASSSTSYDGFGRAIAHVDANNVGSSLGYDHRGHVVALRDPSNPTASLGYDAFDRVLTQTDALGNVTTYAYNTAGLAYTVTTPEGVTHTTTVNHFGQTVSVADAAGGVTKNTTTYAYDKNGNLTSVTDTAGRLQTNTYDNANLQLTMVDANSVTTSITYDAANRVLSRTVDPAGLKLLTTYGYDALGRVATVTDPAGVVTATSYDADGQVTSIVVDSGDASHLNLTTRFSYDSLGRKLSVTDPGNIVTTYSYDADGHGISSVVDNGGLNLTTKVIYDNSGKQLLLRASGQEVARYAYDSAGNLAWQVDATGAVTGYTYDADNHLVKTTRYAKLSSLFTGAQPPAAGQTFTAAQIAASVSADSARDTSVRSFYDKNGRLYATVDALGQATVYLGYNAQDKATETISYGNPVAVSDATTTAALKTLLTQAGQAAPATDRHQLFNYDARGRLTGVLTAIGLNTSGVQQWEVRAIAYDANGNIISSVDYDTPVASNAPTAANIATWIAVAPTAGDVASVMVYDKANRMTASASLLRYNSTTGLNEWAVTTQAYDNNGNVVLRRGYATALALGNGTVPTTSTISTFTAALANLNAADTQISMVYDGANRLIATASALTTATSATAVSSWSVSTQAYDADGNVTQRRAYATALKLTGNGKAPSGADIAAFTSAPANSSTADRQVYLGYDRANRLTTTASAGAILNGAVQWELASRQYDGYGNLVKLTQYAGAVDGSALGANVSAAALAARVVANSGDDRATAYRYDLDNRLTDTVDAAGYLTHYDYDSAGRTTQTTRYATAIAAGSFTAPAASADDRVTRTLYDVVGRVLGQLDADGYLVRNIYNTAGQLIETIAYANAAPAGSRATGDLAALTPALDANDVHQHFLYNPAGQLIASVDGENYLTEFSYDAVGNLVKRTRHALAVTTPGAATVAGMGLTANAGDQVTTYTYTSLRQLLTQTDPDGTVTLYTYDGVGNQVELRRAVGATDERAVQSRYDALGRVVAQLTPQGVAAIGASTDATVIANAWTAYSVKYTYNGAGQRASMTDQNGNRTLYYYDLSGNLSYQIDAAGEVTAYSYSTFDQQSAVTQINGRIAAAALAALTGNETAASIAATVAAIAPQGAGAATGARYDRLGRLIERTDALGFRMTNSYDAFGDLLRTVDVTSGIANTYQYDHRGNLLQSTSYSNPALITRTSYDAFGRAVTRTDANNVAHSVGYDRLGHAISFQDPANPTATVRYDAFGRVLSMTDKLGNATTYSYNTAGLAFTVTTPEGISHTTTQNHFGQTVAVSDALNGSVNNTTTYVYDKNGNLTSVTDGKGKLQSATYDKANLQLTSVDGNNITTTVTYDAANRVLSRTVDPAGLKLLTTYSYDALGRQVTATDPNGVVTTTSYDADGQVTSIVVDSGDASHLNLTTRFSYDSLGRKLSVTDPAGVVATYGYDANGHASGSVADAGGLNIQTRVIYDSTGNNLLLRATGPGQVTRYAYDNAGNLIWQVDATGAVTGYTYDADNRLVKTTRYSKLSTLFTGAEPPAADRTFSAAEIAASVGADARDTSTRTFYDKNGRIYATFDAAGNATVYLNYNIQDKAGEVISYANAVAVNDSTTVADLVTAFAKAGQASAADRHQYFTYDARGRMTGIVTAVGPNASKVMQWKVTTLVYDNNDNLVKRIDRAALKGLDTPSKADMATWLGAAPVNADDQTLMMYDPANRLVATANLVSVSSVQDDTDPSIVYTTNTWSISTQAYDANGNVIQRNDYTKLMSVSSGSPPTAASIANFYSPATSTDAADTQTNLVYDGANRLVGSAVAQGGIGAARTWNVTTLGYDQDGNLVSRRVAATVLTGATVTAAQIIGVAVNASDELASYQYDHLGRRVATAEAQGQNAQGATQWALSTSAYSATGQVLRAVRYATLYTGALPADLTALATTLAGGNDQVNRYAYDQDGRQVLSVNAENEVTQLVYDSRGNAVESIQYGALDAIPDSLDGWQPAAGVATPRISRTVYDQDDRPVLKLDAQGDVTETRYDALGNTIATIRYANPLGTAQSAALGAAPTVEQVRTVLVTDAQNDRKTRYVYNDLGQLRFTVDAAGYITENRYNGLGQLTNQYAYAVAKQLADSGLADAVVAEATAQSSTARATTYTYDLNGNVLTATDAAGGIKKYTYDGVGRQLTYIDELNNSWLYTYDAQGHKLTETSPKVAAYTSAALTAAMGSWGAGTQTSLVTRYAYNALGQLASKTEAAGTAMERTTTYAYDRVGRLVTTTQPSIKVYDAANDALSSAGTVVAMEKDSGPRATKVTYDAFGDAVATTDLGGVTSYSVFDKQGRKTADIDALGYVTGYQLNGFGEVARLTRYDASIGVQSAPLTQAALQPLLPVNPAFDRTLVNSYDQLGRLVQTREPAVEVYDQSSLGQSARLVAAKTTATRYNAFGEVIESAVYGADLQGNPVTAPAVTRHYYDAVGNVSATIEALSATAGAQRGYLTTFVYDLAGNVLTRKEFSNAITGWTDTGYQAVTADAKLDRETGYTYDKLDHVLTETVRNATYVDTATNTVVTGNVATTYAYNARGERTTVIDALKGATYTYYDRIGRVTGVAQTQSTAVTGITTATASLTQYLRDIQGNVILAIDYAAGTASASAASATPADAANVANRVTATAYDLDGDAVQVIDPEQFSKTQRGASYISRDVYGRIAKQWQKVTSGATTQTSYQVQQYDALGRVIATTTPNDRDGSASASDVLTYQYNGYGELLSNSRGEAYRYDQAGNRWLGTVNGIDQVTLHDAMGQATATIVSNGTDLHALQALSSASEALTLHDVLRTDTRYDALGHVVDVSTSTGDQVELLQQVNGVWTKSTTAVNQAAAGSLLVIGTRQDGDKTFTVRYRLIGSADWADAPASAITWIDGYPTFSTAGLAGGDYAYQVYVQPAGEPAYLSVAASLSITTRARQLDQVKQLIAFHLWVDGGAPTQQDIGRYLEALADGKTVAQVAATIYAGSYMGVWAKESAVFYLVGAFGKNVFQDPAAYAEAQALYEQIDAVNLASGRNGEVLLNLLNASPPVFEKRAAALLNYLVLQGGANVDTASHLLLDADTAVDGAIAEGTSAAIAERQGDEVISLYVALFGAMPSRTDANTWRAALQSGASTVQDVAQALVNKQAAGLVGDAAQRQLVNTVYQNLFGRDPSTQEMQARLAQLNGIPALASGAFVLSVVREVSAYQGADSSIVQGRTRLFDSVKLAQAYLALRANATDAEITSVGTTYIDGIVASSSTSDAAGMTTLNLYNRMVNTQRTLADFGNTDELGASELKRLKLASLYVTILGRAPELNEFTAGMTLLQSANGYAQLATQLLQAQAASGARFPASLSDSQFAAQLYQQVYGQAAGVTKLFNWTTVVQRDGRGAAVEQLVTALLGDQSAGAHTAQLLLQNQASVAINYAQVLSYSDTRVGTEIIARVTASDVKAALAYAQDQRAAFEKLKDLATDLQTINTGMQNWGSYDIRNLEPRVQAAILYHLVLARPINGITAAELTGMADVIQNSGINAAVQQLLATNEAKTFYGAELTDGVGLALAQHLYTLVAPNLPAAPGSLGYWANYLKTDMASAFVDILNGRMGLVPPPTTDIVLRDGQMARGLWNAMANAWITLGLTTSSQLYSTMESLTVLIDGDHAAKAILTAQPETAKLLQIVQALTPLPGVTVDNAAIFKALAAMQGGATLSDIVTGLLLQTPGFNPGGLPLANAVAALPRTFAAALYANLNWGTPVQTKVDAFWNQLKSSNDIGALLVQLANPSYGASTVAGLTTSLTNAAYISMRQTDKLNQLSPTVAQQLDNKQVYDNQFARADDLRIMVYAVHLALTGKIGGMNELFATDKMDFEASLWTNVNSLLQTPEAQARMANAQGAADFVHQIYDAFGWPATDADVQRNADRYARGVSRAELVIDMAYEIIDYAGPDLAYQSARLGIVNQLHNAVAAGKAELAALATPTASANTAAGAIAALPLYSADLHVVDANSSAVRATLTSRPQPSITVDRWGNVLTVADARDANWKISYTYNYRNELIDQTANALAGTTAQFHTQQRYDALGRLAAMVDANGNTTSFNYDSHGNVVTETHADGGKVTSTYSLFGQRLSVTQPANVAVQRNYTYDHLGNLLTSSTGTTLAVYAVNASMVATVSTNKVLTDSYTYDELGRRVSSTDAAGAVSKQVYDLSGNVIKTIDAMGYTTTSTYDDQHHMVLQIDANGTSQGWVYWNGSLALASDLSGNTTSYTYNAAGQKIAQTSSRGQDVRYTYDEDKLVRVDDVITGLTTDYAYDAAGNRITEKQTYANWVGLRPDRVQNNTLTYDMQNRLVGVLDDQYKLTYAYDYNGNRTQTTTEFDGGAFDAYNTYDSMNRQLIVNGDLVAGKVVYGQYGHQIVYDKAGNRVSDTYLGVKVSGSANSYATTLGVATTDVYTYDAAGRLATIKHDVLLVDTVHYDAAGRVVESGFIGAAADLSLKNAAAAIGMASDAQTYTYDANGRTTRQLTRAAGGVASTDIKYIAQGATGYDNVGNMLGYTVTNLMGASSDEYTFTYDVNSSYVQKYVQLNNDSTTTYVYNVNGQRTNAIRVNTKTNETSDTSYWYDADGHIQSRKEDGVVSFSLIVDGNVLGAEDKARTNFIGQNYTPATSAIYDTAPGVYTTQGNEKLSDVAQRLWGDASLWYLIGDLNGIEVGTVLTAGRVLKIPPRVNTIHNTYKTYRPYSEGAALGDTMPLASPSNADNCGAMGGIVTTTIAIAASYITTGKLSDKAIGYLQQQLGDARAVNEAMKMANQIALQVVDPLLKLSTGKANTLAADFLQSVLNNDGSQSAVEGAYSKYGNSIAANPTTIRDALVRTANAGAHIMTGLRTAFDWKGIAKAQAAEAARRRAEALAAARAAAAKAAADQKAIDDKKALDQKALDDKKALDQKAIDDKKALDQKAVDDKKALDQKAVDDKKALDQKALDDKKALDEQQKKADTPLKEAGAAPVNGAAPTVTGTLGKVNAPAGFYFDPKHPPSDPAGRAAWNDINNSIMNSMSRAMVSATTRGDIPDFGVRGTNPDHAEDNASRNSNTFDNSSPTSLTPVDSSRPAVDLSDVITDLNDTLVVNQAVSVVTGIVNGLINTVAPTQVTTGLSTVDQGVNTAGTNNSNTTTTVDIGAGTNTVVTNTSVVDTTPVNTNTTTTSVSPATTTVTPDTAVSPATTTVTPAPATPTATPATVQIDLPDFKFDSPALEPIALETASFAPVDRGPRSSSPNYEGNNHYAPPEVSPAADALANSPGTHQQANGGVDFTNSIASSNGRWGHEMTMVPEGNNSRAENIAPTIANADRNDASLMSYGDQVNNATSFIGKAAVGIGETVLAGTWNQGVRIAGGLASLPYLADSVDAALAVQQGFNDRFGYTVNTDGGKMIGGVLGQLGNAVQRDFLTPLRNSSESTIGAGATTILGAAVQAGIEIAGVVSAGRSVQSLLENPSVGASGGGGYTYTVAEFDGSTQKIGRGLNGANSTAAETVLFENKFPLDAIGDPKIVPTVALKNMSGNLNYVVLEDGSLVVGKSPHTSLTNNTSVQAAGEIQLYNGNVKWLDNASGHYQPTGPQIQGIAESAFGDIGLDATGKFQFKSWAPDPSLPRGGKWVKQ